jgi:hypothetical protein
MWKLTENKKTKGQQELRVKILLNEMCQNSYATYAGEFENHFKTLIKEIPRTNNFSANLLYKVTQRNLYSVEVWKMTVNGEFKHKLFTLDYINS